MRRRTTRNGLLAAALGASLGLAACDDGGEPDDVGGSDGGPRDAADVAPGDAPVGGDAGPDGDDAEPVDAGPPPERELVVTGMDYERVTYDIGVSGRVTRGRNLEGDDRVEGSRALGSVVAANATDVFRFSGEVTEVEVDGGARVTADGEILAGGPEAREGEVEGAPTIRVSVRSSLGLLKRNGRTSERMAALYVARAIEDAGYGHEVVHHLTAVDPPQEKAVCGTETPPWWRQRVQGEEVEGLRKDGNLLLVDVNGGGCSGVADRYGSAPARHVSGARPWVAVGTGDWHRNMHAILHELGHQLGARHDHDLQQDGQQHWGWGWNEADPITGGGFWHRTPNVAGNGAPNQCGGELEERQYDPVMHHQLYAPCATKNLVVQPED